MKIRTKIRLSFGIILFLVGLLSVLTLIQTDKLWQQTEGMYNHPLQVRRALMDLEGEVSTIQKSMKEIISAANHDERLSIIQDIDISESNILRKELDTIKNNYLGPTEDVDAVYDEVIKWKSIRGETIRLLEEGSLSEATRRVSNEGVEYAQTERVYKAINLRLTG